MVEQVKFYAKGVVNGILLSTWFWDTLDQSLKFVTVSLGAVLTFFLIKKAIADEKLSKEKRRGEKLMNDMKEQELWAKVAQNKKNGI
jgi:hypothetical protein